MIDLASPASVRRDVAAALCVTAGYAETIERVARLAVAHLAKLCFVDLKEDGILTRRAIVVDPVLGSADLLMQAPHPDVGEGAAAALRRGVPLVYGRGWFAALSQADAALTPFIASPLKSVLMVPLFFDSQPIGALTLGQLSSVAEADLDLASDFARLAAMAIANARFYEEARSAKRSADESRVRLNFVSRASSVFARSFDLPTTLQRFATTTVSDFADGASVLVLPIDGRPERYDAGAASDTLSETLRGQAMSDARTRLDVGAHAISTPLLKGGKVSGALTFVRYADKPNFDLDDLTLVEELAARTAMYVETAQAFERQRSMATALQRAFRPSELPEITGLTICAAYRPSSADMDVGGDWYDVVVLDDNRVAFVIGDVMGHGAESAAVMAEIRSGLRAHLYAQSAPGRCLGHVDTLLAATRDREIFATGAVAFYDRVSRKLTVANAGHPAPYLRRADGSLEALGYPALLLGLDQGPRVETSRHLEPGDTVLFFTDGVVEYRALPFDEGIGLLEEGLKRWSGPAEITAYLLDVSKASTDDRTILAFRVRDEKNA